MRKIYINCPHKHAVEIELKIDVLECKYFAFVLFKHPFKWLLRKEDIFILLVNFFWLTKFSTKSWVRSLTKFVILVKKKKLYDNDLTLISILSINYTKIIFTAKLIYISISLKIFQQKNCKLKQVLMRNNQYLKSIHIQVYELSLL